MPGRYAIEGSVAVAADTALGLVASATVRPRCYYVSVSSESAPADATVLMEFKVTDGTAAGTKTAVTPEKLDGADKAAVATAGQTYTAEPTTYNAVPLLRFGLNQKLIYQFYAQEGGEFILAATANLTLGAFVSSFSTGTPIISAVMHFQE